MNFNIFHLYEEEDHPDVTIDSAKELAEIILAKYQFDFTNYAVSSFKRRIISFMRKHNIKEYDELKRKILKSYEFFERFLNDVTVNTTELFRDPEVWRILSEKVIPILAAKEKFSIWHAACSSGEEVLSMAILLKEHGILDKVEEIYATDINSEILEIAKTGEYPMRYWDGFLSNYRLYNPEGDLKNHCKIKKGKIIFNKELTEKVIYKQHDLVVDEPIKRFDIVFCRNVLIYFNPKLQDHVIRLLYNSLKEKGILVIGSKESLIWSSLADNFEGISSYERIYRKAY